MCPKCDDAVEQAMGCGCMGNLYTIGHSTVEIDFFLHLLHLHDIDCVFDVRSTPYSKYASQYNKDVIGSILKNNGIRYVYMGTYFGARQEDWSLYDDDGILDFEKVRASEAFNIRMKSVERGLDQGHNIALMCTEKDPFDCHRAIMVGRGFELDNIQVNHILQNGKLQSQQELNERLLDCFFPDRGQLSLNFNDEKEKSDQECLVEAYQKRNKQIGYHIETGYRNVV